MNQSINQSIDCDDYPLHGAGGHHNQAHPLLPHHLEQSLNQLINQSLNLSTDLSIVNQLINSQKYRKSKILPFSSSSIYKQ
jgi:hypothetical protein